MKAAELGENGAMYSLGAAYEDGLGVENNYGEALRWYQKAYDFGLEKAEAKLEELLKRI